MANVDACTADTLTEFQRNEQRDKKYWHRRVSWSLATGFGLFALAAYFGDRYGDAGATLWVVLAIIAFLVAAFASGIEIGGDSARKQYKELLLKFAECARVAVSESAEGSESAESILAQRVQAAHQLLREYGAVLEKERVGMSGIFRPESTLPASKDEIKPAFRLVTLWHILAGDFNKKIETADSRGESTGSSTTLKDTYVCCYMALADFVSEETAAKESSMLGHGQAAIQGSREDRKEHLEQSIQMLGEIVREKQYESSLAETERLAAEFSRFLDAAENLMRT